MTPFEAGSLIGRRGWGKRKTAQSRRFGERHAGETSEKICERRDGRPGFIGLASELENEARSMEAVRPSVRGEKGGARSHVPALWSRRWALVVGASGEARENPL